MYKQKCVLTIYGLPSEIRDEMKTYSLILVQQFSGRYHMIGLCLHSTIRHVSSSAVIFFFEFNFILIFFLSYHGISGVSFDY